MILNTYRLKDFFLSVILLCTAFSSAVFAAPENLDEMARRKARHSTAAWGNAILEKENHIWQPETLCYYDEAFGTEIWRLTNTPSKKNYWYDITYPNFSADGKRIAFISDRDTGAFSNSSYNIWMAVRTDGRFLRPMVESVARVEPRAQIKHWDPSMPDTLYEFGTPYAGRSGSNDYHILYRTTVGDRSISTTRLLELSTPGQKQLLKTMSSDGKTALAMNSVTEERLWPLTLGDTPKVDVPAGFTADRPTIDHFWGGDWREWGGYHDQFLHGSGDDAWFYFMPVSKNGVTGKWWRMKLTGSDSDGGSRHQTDHGFPYAWGNELEPAVTSGYGGVNDPWKNAKNAGFDVDNPEYLSHVVWDRWGRFAAYAGAGDHVAGHAIWDFKTHKFSYMLYKTPKGNLWPLHTDWHAFSDWIAGSTYVGNRNKSSLRIDTWHYKDENSHKVLANARRNVNTGESGNGTYESSPRPSQSPDGTKVVFHSTFLNNANASNSSNENSPDIYYAVAYYPYPPEIIGVSAASGAVSVRVDWRLGQDNPRGYTQRGWPNEETDDPPPPREIRQFRLWRSSDAVNWSPVSKAPHNIFNRYDFQNGGFKSGQSSHWDLDDRPGDGTFYYGVTSTEHSGLESRVLSNIQRVSIVNGCVTESVRHAAYPDNPGSAESFYKVLPAEPQGFKWVAQSHPGHYQLTWREPEDASGLIRFYNIYYSPTENPPAALPRNRIASLSKGISEYMDWAASPNQPAHYRITSVDHLGNESTDTGFYSLTTTTTGNGSINQNPLGKDFEYNQIVHLTPLPQSGFEFSSWGGDATGNRVPLSVVMNSDKSISAIFVESGSENLSPEVNAGDPIHQAPVNLPVTLVIGATVTDDGLPNPPGRVSLSWRVTEGDAGNVSFNDHTLEDPRVTISAYGSYTLELTANDGELRRTGTTRMVFNPVSGPDIISPSVPGNLNASSPSHQTVLITWQTSSDNIGVDGYEVFREDMGRIAQLGGSLTRYSDTTVVTDTTYTYWVKAFDEEGNVSHESNHIEIKTPSNNVSGKSSILYRSVGKNSGNLNTSHSTITIHGSMADFSKELPTHVGVGDVLVYNGNIAMVQQRHSSRQLTVQAINGETPVAAASGTAVLIYRAYTSLKAWNQLAENSTIGADFDTSRDLVGEDVSLKVACYADAVDSSQNVQIKDWTTDETHTITIFAPSKNGAVGKSQRHNGIWREDAYTIRSGLTAIEIQSNHVTLKGLQIETTGSRSWVYGIYINGAGGSRLNGNIIRFRGSGTACHGIRSYSARNLIISNMLVYGYRNSAGLKLGGGSGSIHCLNTTVVNCRTGIESGYLSVIAQNNLVQTMTTGFGGDLFHGDSDFNISNCNDAPNKTFKGGNATVSFADAAADNYHLSSTDTLAKDAGMDLSRLLTMDVDDVLRSGTFDIGADEVTSGGGENI